MFMEIKFCAVEIPQSPESQINYLLNRYRLVDSASVCPGNPDEKFISMVKAKKKGVVKSTSGDRTAAIDNAFHLMVKYINR